MTTHEEQLATTETAILAALVKAGRRRPLRQVTVSEISQLSGINRGTFYLHYLDKDDLVEKQIQAVLHDLQAIITADMGTTLDMAHFDAAHPYPVIAKVVAVLAAKHDWIQLLLSEHGEPSFLTRVKALLVESVNAKFHAAGIPAMLPSGIPTRYMSQIVVGELINLVQIWLTDDAGVGQADLPGIMMTLLARSPYDLVGRT